MENYIKIQPEVIVGLGSKTVFAEDKPPFKTIVSLHIDLEDWLGDDLMECFPAYIVTEDLKLALQKSSYDGFEFKEIEVSKAEYFENNYQLEKKLPIFHWMKVTGEQNINDIFVENKELFVKPRFLKFLQNRFNLKFMDIEPVIDTERDDILKKLLARAKSRDN